jgi:hypothetical protein
MKRSFYLIAFMLVFSLLKVSAQSCTGCSTSITGNDTLTYNVSAGQMLCITSSGNFLGNITISGGTLCVSGNFNPKGITCTSGAINNYGTSSIASSISLPSGFSINNNAGGIFNISSDLTLNSGSLINNGIVNVVNAIANSGSITNSNIINCVQITGSGTLNDTGIINSN